MGKNHQNLHVTAKSDLLCCALWNLQVPKWLSGGRANDFHLWNFKTLPCEMPFDKSGYSGFSLSGPIRLMLSPIFSELHWLSQAHTQIHPVIALQDHFISPWPESSQTRLHADSYGGPPTARRPTVDTVYCSTLSDEPHFLLGKCSADSKNLEYINQMVYSQPIYCL